MIRLKARRILIFESISNYLAVHGRGPTVREIGGMVGLSSSSSVAHQLAQLEKDGLLARGTRSWSSVELTGTGQRRLAAAQSITAVAALSSRSYREVTSSSL
ncbi:LexA family protein [Streptomyces sp. NPDC060048]|uniref:LexA family protein n=1 Tax=unclassified Streptomyces TaxID=2593676 RepID=UPI0036809AE7